MKKRYMLRYLIAGLIASLLLTGANVCAEENPYKVEYDYYNEKATVTVSVGESDSNIVMQVLKTPYTFDELRDKSASEAEGMLLYSKQLPAKNGTDSIVFSVGYRLPADFEIGETPVYNNARIVASPSGEKTDLELLLISKDSYLRIFSKLEEAIKNNDKDDFVSQMRTNKIYLDLNYPLEDSVNMDTVLGNFYNYAKTNGISPDKMNENTHTYRLFILFEALNNKKVSNAFDYEDDIFFERSDIRDEFRKIAWDESKKAYNSEMCKYFTEKLSNKGINGMESYDKALKTALILTGVRYGSGYGVVKNLLAEYGDAVGITEAADDTVYRDLLGMNFSTGDELLKEYNRLKNKGTDSNPSTGGGGSSSGGFSSGGSSLGTSRYDDTIINPDSRPQNLAMIFNDIDGVEWASEAILALADKGIVNGTGDGNFKPNNNVKREEFAKMLICAMQYEGRDFTDGGFTDVGSNDWFYPYVNIAYRYKIVNGIGDQLFGAGDNITRQDMVTMLLNALCSKGSKLEIAEAKDIADKFADYDEIADYAKEAVSTFYNIGVVSGVSESEFKPADFATRAEAAKVIYGVLPYLQ
ncbi:MAG: S-layer homology domain-containing protein [Monoglobaceae bacterium]